MFLLVSIVTLKLINVTLCYVKYMDIRSRWWVSWMTSWGPSCMQNNNNNSIIAVFFNGVAIGFVMFDPSVVICDNVLFYYR